MPLNPDPSPSANPLYQTDLAQTPLPEILVTVHRHKAPGTIDCRRGTERKEIYVDSGHIIFATSNQVRDSLGDKLLREGKITPEQYEESVRRLVATGQRQGTILADMELLDATELVKAVREQIEEIVWSVFSWNAGTVGFTPGRERHNEFVRVDLPIRQAVLDGVRHMPDAKPLIARLGSKSTILMRTGVPIDDLSLDEHEQLLLDQINGRHTLYGVVNTPPLSAGLNARILYAFLALQLISTKDPAPIKVQVRTSGGEFSS
jgi:hypothetical protein